MEQSPLTTSNSTYFYYLSPSTKSTSICNCFHKNRHHYHRPREGSREITVLNSLHKQSSLSNSITGSESPKGSNTSSDEALRVAQSVTLSNDCQQAANMNFHEITMEKVCTNFQQLTSLPSMYPVSATAKYISSFHSNQIKLQHNSNLSSCGRNHSQDLNYCYFNKTTRPSIPFKSKMKSQLFNSKHFTKNMHHLSFRQLSNLRCKRTVFRKSSRERMELRESTNGFEVIRTRKEFPLLNKSRSQELPVSKIQYPYNGFHSQSANEPLCYSCVQHFPGPNQENGNKIL